MELSNLGFKQNAEIVSNDLIKLLKRESVETGKGTGKGKGNDETKVEEGINNLKNIYLDDNEAKEEIINKLEDGLKKFQKIEEFKSVNEEDIQEQMFESIQRENEINVIYNNVASINSILHDMDSMVLQQGELVDNIENNIFNVRDNVKFANREMNKANYWDKKRRRCKFLLYIAVVVFFIILLLLLV